MSDKNDSFDKMISEFKSFEDLKKFSSAQHATIIKMGKKLKDLEDENRKLKTGHITVAPAIATPTTAIPVSLNGLTNEELICLVQLSFLKQTSDERELTLEEAKKVDIYNKILSNIKEKENKPSSELTSASTEDLLKLVE